MSVKLDPIAFCVAVLGIKGLYSWQACILHDVFSKQKVTVRAPNGSGKTANIVAPLALWLAHEYPGSTVVITSATYTQVSEQIFAALKIHKNKFLGWRWTRDATESPQGSRIIGRATNEGGRFEGFHAYPERPLMVIVDEAKTISDEIFTSIDRCDPTYLLYVSSPGGSVGRFYDSFVNPRFATHSISYKDCPHISDERAEEIKSQYGEQSDIYRSMILGEFSLGLDDGCVIPYSIYENCLRSPPQEKDGRVNAFCDFAESTDENVLAIKRGNRVIIADAWVQHNGSRAEVKERFIRLFKEHELRPDQIWGDGDGVGGGYILALADSRWPINEFRNKNYPTNNRYFNPSAEAWFKAANMIRNCEIILPHDTLLKKQICSRKKVEREDGRLQLEPKRSMEGKSPDRADAVVGCLIDKQVQPISYIHEEVDRPWREHDEEEIGAIAGANAGI